MLDDRELRTRLRKLSEELEEKIYQAIDSMDLPDEFDSSEINNKIERLNNLIELKANNESIKEIYNILKTIPDINPIKDQIQNIIKSDQNKQNILDKKINQLSTRLEVEIQDINAKYLQKIKTEIDKSLTKEKRNIRNATENYINEKLEGTSGGSLNIRAGVSRETAESIAKSFVDGLDANITARGGVLGGNIALTNNIVMKTTDGKAQICSLDDGNVVEIYESGNDLSSGVVKSRLFLSKGEIHIETGLSDGAIIISTKGVYGASGCSGASGKSPMPLGIEAFSGKQFFLFSYRNSSDPEGSSKGEIYVAAGAVQSTVALYDKTGVTIVDGPVELDAFEITTLVVNANDEFQIVADQPVFCGMAAEMGGDNPSFYDMRLIPPLAVDLIGQNRQARVSSLYDDTVVYWYRQNATMGKFTVSPGSPVQINTGVINELGDVFEINSDTTPATGGTFTININPSSGILTTSALPFDANAIDIKTALGALSGMSEDDFKVFMVRKSNLGESGAIVRIECSGTLERISALPSIDTTGLVGNVHSRVMVQNGTSNDNAGSTGDYAANGTVRLLATGPISAFSGADGVGLEATYFQDPSTFSQRVALPLGSQGTGGGDTTSIAVKSIYTGTAKLYNSDGSLKDAFDLVRSGTVTSRYSQYFPTGYTLDLSGDTYQGGWIEADVPIYVVQNSNENESQITDGIETSGDEIVMLGITPEDIRVNIVADEEGILRRRAIDSSGTETWVTV
jgi:hypothetical protein